GESGSYQCDYWKIKSDLVAAINQQEGVNLDNNSTVEITDFSIDYSWTYTSTEEEKVPNIMVWPAVWGNDANGNAANNSGDLVRFHDKMKGGGTFSTAECEDSGVQSLDIIWGFSLDAGASTNNPDDVLEFSWDSVTFTVRYLEGSKGDWKSFNSEGRQWEFVHYTDDEGTMSSYIQEISKAIKAKTNETPRDWTIKVNNISADYNWVFKTELENPEVSMYTMVNGDTGTDWAESESVEQKFNGTEGSGTISAAALAKEAGLSIADYQGLFIDMGTWTDNPADTLTLTLSNITFDVTYQTSGYEAPEGVVTVTVPDMTEVIDYSDIPQAEYQTTEITLTPNWNGSVSFAGVNPEGEPELRQMYNEATDSGNYSFDCWNNRAEIVSAIEANEGVTLTDDSPIEMTAVSMTYSWKYTTTDVREEYSIGAWPNVWGYDANGNGVKIGDTYTGYTSKEGSGVFNTATSTISGVQDLDNIHGFGLDMGAWTNNPEDTLDVTVESITLTVRYSVSAAGGNKDGGFEIRHYNDDGTATDFTEQVLDSVKEQTGSRPEAWEIQIRNITADYEWSFKTARDAPVINISSNSAGFCEGDENWREGEYVHDGYSGKTGSCTISAYESAVRGGTDLTDLHIMRVSTGSWTDDPDDTLTFTLKNITVDVVIQNGSSDDYPCSYLTYEDLQNAKYVEVGFSINKKGECGHDSHVSEDGVDYSEGKIYCAWPIVYVNRISSDGTWSETYSYFQGSSDSGYLSVLIPMTSIIDTTGELTEGDTLRFTCNESGVVQELTVYNEGEDFKLKTGNIDEVFIEEDYYWDNEKGESVPNGKPNIITTLTIASYGPNVPFAIEGYDALKIDYTLKNPGKCSGMVVILHGWNDNNVGWDMRYYEANSEGSIIIDLSDMQDKTFNNIYVGPVAQPTAQIGDSFTPCFTVTDAALLSSCSEAATAQIDPIELADPTEYDEFGKKTVNVTIDSDWTNTIDFSGVDIEEGEFRHFYNPETESDIWEIVKYANDEGKISPEIISAIEEQIGDTPCDWPFVINDITAVCEWEVSTDGTGSGETGTVKFIPNAFGMADVPEGEEGWRDANSPDIPSLEFSERTGSCNISASRVAAYGDVTDISDFHGLSINAGIWSKDPSATLTVRITSVKLNISYVPKNAMYLSYDELKDAKYVKIYSDVAKKTECGHGNPDHIGDDGKSYYDDWTYCPWSAVKVCRISADGKVSDVYEVLPDQGNMPSVTAIRSLSDITAVTGELHEGDVLEFAGSSSETVTKVEVIDSLPDIQLDSKTIDEVTIEEDSYWDPVLEESVPNGRVGRQYAQMMHDHHSAIKINDYPVVKINYTLKNPDECRAIVVILNGWDENGTGWVTKYYPVSGNSGTIIADFSDLMDKMYYQVYVGVITRPTVKIGDAFTPGFTAEGVLMNSYSDKITEEYDYHADDVVLAENIEIVENIYSEESDDPYILTIDELEAIEAVLDNDYNK
ncbi:MAG: hypothetical protein ACI4K7_10865, partial [Oscillospiraceae bacterium]